MYCQQSQHESSAQSCTNNPPTIRHHNTRAQTQNNHSSQPSALQRLTVPRISRSTRPGAATPPALNTPAKPQTQTKTHPRLHMPAPSKLSRRRAHGNQDGRYRYRLSSGQVQAMCQLRSNQPTVDTGVFCGIRLPVAESLPCHRLFKH